MKHLLTIVMLTLSTFSYATEYSQYEQRLLNIVNVTNSVCTLPSGSKRSFAIDDNAGEIIVATERGEIIKHKIMAKDLTSNASTVVYTLPTIQWEEGTVEYRSILLVGMMGYVETSATFRGNALVSTNEKSYYNCTSK